MRPSPWPTDAQMTPPPPLSTSFFSRKRRQHRRGLDLGHDSGLGPQSHPQRSVCSVSICTFVPAKHVKLSTLPCSLTSFASFLQYAAASLEVQFSLLSAFSFFASLFVLFFCTSKASRLSTVLQNEQQQSMQQLLQSFVLVKQVK